MSISNDFLVLGKVLRTIASEGNMVAPYKEASLTRFLMDSLGGDSETILIACIKPDPSHEKATRSIIDFVLQARSQGKERKSKKNSVSDVLVSTSNKRMKTVNVECEDDQRSISAGAKPVLSELKCHTEDPEVTEALAQFASQLKQVVHAVVPAPNKKKKEQKYLCRTCNKKMPRKLRMRHIKQFHPQTKTPRQESTPP